MKTGGAEERVRRRLAVVREQLAEAARAVIAPCGTPLLASILSYAAYRGSLPYGGLLLFVYGIGVSVPVLLLGVTAARLAARLDRSGLRRWVDRATGALLLGMGFYLLWGA